MDTEAPQSDWRTCERLTRQQAAKILCVSARTLDRMLSTGVLTRFELPKVMRRVYVDARELAAYVDGGPRAVADYRRQHPRKFRRR